jgi:hypothetical protein
MKETYRKFLRISASSSDIHYWLAVLPDEVACQQIGVQICRVFLVTLHTTVPLLTCEQVAEEGHSTNRIL